MSVEVLDDIGVENLRSAIVISAINDYRKAKEKSTKDYLIKWFLSDWGQLLSGNLGELIIKNL